MSESKKTIFCQIFRFILHKSSSVARMSKRDKSEVFKGKGNKGKIEKQWERERMRVKETRNDRDREPKVGWSPGPLATKHAITVIELFVRQGPRCRF